LAKGRDDKNRRSPVGRQNAFYYLGTRDTNTIISSIETDGIGVSIVLCTEAKMNRFRASTEPKTDAQKREYAERERRRKVASFAALLPKAIIKGLDPGRVNLYTTAEKKEDGTHKRQFYSRNRHLEKTGRLRFEAWRNERSSQAEIAEAMKALSLSAGAHCCDMEKWILYMTTRHVHRETLWREFLEEDERCKQRMVAFRLGQRALARAADSLVKDGVLQKRPVIIGYGTGRGSGGGHKGEPSVPVKAMYRALKEAFKRHRCKGGILDVWEFYTTLKCHRCHEVMKTREIPWTAEDIEKADKKAKLKFEQSVYEAQRKIEKGESGVTLPEHPPPHDPPLETRMKRDRDFRICEHCSNDDQTRKIRNRDFNAAINILKLLESEINFEGRPGYLCPDKCSSRTQSKKCEPKKKTKKTTKAE